MFIIMYIVFFLLFYFLISFDCVASDLECLQGIWIEAHLDEEEQATKMCLIFTKHEMISIRLDNDEIGVVYTDPFYLVPSESIDLNKQTIDDVKKNENGEVYMPIDGIDDDNLLISESSVSLDLSCDDDELFIKSAIYHRGDLTYDQKLEVYNVLGYYPNFYIVKSDKTIVYDSSFVKTKYVLPQNHIIEVTGEFNNYFKVIFHTDLFDIKEGYIRKKDVDY